MPCSSKYQVPDLVYPEHCRLTKFLEEERSPSRNSGDSEAKVEIANDSWGRMPNFDECILELNEWKILRRLQFRKNDDDIVNSS
ncbi:hypothetical protein ACS0TY_016794 [Phlomoides rotata]